MRMVGTIRALKQTWTRGQFSNLTLTPIANITAAIKALVQPKQYVPDTEGYRTTTDGAGFNEVCIPDGTEMPSSMRFSRYFQRVATLDSNTGTELHTTSMVPRRLRTVDSDVSNPLHGNPRAVKRWALHFLLGYNETLNNTLPPGTVAFNPVHSARQFIAVNLDGRVYESVIHNLSAGDLDPSQVAPWLRNYVSTFRGASPGILYNGTKNAYTTRDASGYTLANYFQICPKVSPWLLCRLIVLRTPAHHLGVTHLDPDCYFAVDFCSLVDRVLTLPPQDYAEALGTNGGFAWICRARCIFFTDGCLDRYRTNSLFSRDPLTSIGPRMGPTMWAPKGLQKSLTIPTPIDLHLTARFSTNCKIEPVDGLPSGSPFWSSPPEQVKGWGCLEKMSIFCSTVLSSQKMG